MFQDAEQDEIAPLTEFVSSVLKLIESSKCEPINKEYYFYMNFLHSYVEEYGGYTMSFERLIDITNNNIERNYDYEEDWSTIYNY